jgi:hypothetical protein
MKTLLSLAIFCLILSSCEKKGPEDYSCNCYDANDQLVVVIPIKTEGRQHAIEVCKNYESAATNRDKCALQ